MPSIVKFHLKFLQLCFSGINEKIGTKQRFFFILTGLAFRGNGLETAQKLNFDADKNYFRSDACEGNFIGIVKLLAGDNDDLAEHLRSCEEHAKAGGKNQFTFLSSSFIKTTLRIIKVHLVQKIVDEINNSGGNFGILIDGSQDVTTKEQISMTVRYVDISNAIVERTIGFVNASKDMTGNGLYNATKQTLSDVGLLMSKINGCSFDGGSAMRSDKIGVQAFIKKDNPRCIFTWCLSHRFNLVMKTAINGTTRIKIILQTAEECAKIFRGSPKRMDIWINVAKTINLNGVITKKFNSMRRLKLIGTTRWSSNQDAIAGIIDSEMSLCVLIKSLIKVCNLPNLDGTVLKNASDCLNFWLQYDNIVMTFMLHKTFLLVMPTTKFLQSYGLNAVDGIKSLKKSKAELNTFELNLHTYIENARQFVKDTNYLLKNDSDIIYFRFQCDSDSEDLISVPLDLEKINEKIKNEILIFVQLLQKQIDDRILDEFNEYNSIFNDIMYLDPEHAAKNVDSISFKNLCELNNIFDDKKTVEEMKKFLIGFSQYKRPKAVSLLGNDEYIDTENDSCLTINDNAQNLCLLIENEDDFVETTAALQNPNVKFKSFHDKKCECVQCILNYLTTGDRMTKYENIYHLYKFVATLPSTQVKCERDFSKMKIVKSRLRSNLSDESLENLMIISTESNMFETIDLDDILHAIINSSEKLALYMS